MHHGPLKAPQCNSKKPINAVPFPKDGGTRPIKTPGQHKNHLFTSDPSGSKTRLKEQRRIIRNPISKPTGYGPEDTGVGLVLSIGRPIPQSGQIIGGLGHFSAPIFLITTRATSEATLLAPPPTQSYSFPLLFVVGATHDRPWYNLNMVVCGDKSQKGFVR